MNLKTLSETELLENYNRQEKNIKIFGIKEETRTKHNGEVLAEDAETSTKKSMDLGKMIGASIDERISQLPIDYPAGEETDQFLRGFQEGSRR